MITVLRQLILAGLIVVTLQIENVSMAPAEKTVAQLMVSSAELSSKTGLLNYFKDLHLDIHCDFALLDVNNFKMIENEYTSQCLCTVIYNISNEFEYSLVNAIDLDAAKNMTNNHKFKDKTMYTMWTNVTEISQSMKLLMDLLNNITKWNKVCYNLDNKLTSYCKFLNVEVLLLHNSSLEKTKKSIKKNVVSPSKNFKESVIPSAVIEEPKNPESLPQIKADKTPENEINVGNTQKIIEIKNDDNNDEELHAEIPRDNIDDDETTIEDEKQLEETEVQTPIESKPDSKSSVDYPKESDGTINQSETEEVISRLSLKPKFTNPGFGDADGDTHFLFYFSIMTILSMLFYLALYNKKKIIALLIEGRRSTNHRRRPNTSSYSKVETDDGSTVF